MDDTLPQVWLVRHGETEWSRSGKHTGRTDVPLTSEGMAAAERLGEVLGCRPYAAVWSSPSKRASDTCRLAGYADACARRHDLAEWDYGAYEGVKTADILAERPGWDLFRDGCPGGETAADVGTRVDRIISELRGLEADALLFSSAHVLRVLAARWVGLTPEGGALLTLGTASISMLGYEHDLNEPVIHRWNLPGSANSRGGPTWP